MTWTTEQEANASILYGYGELVVFPMLRPGGTWVAPATAPSREADRTRAREARQERRIQGLHDHVSLRGRLARHPHPERDRVGGLRVPLIRAIAHLNWWVRFQMNPWRNTR